MYQNHMLKNANFIKDVIICKSCKRKFDIGKPFDLVLWNHIITNQLNINCILMLIKIEKRLISACLTFAQMFQLQRHGQYGLHGSIVNVLTNLNIIQTILPCMPYEDHIIFVFFKKIIEYKSIYMFWLCLTKHSNKNITRNL